MSSPQSGSLHRCLAHWTLHTSHTTSLDPYYIPSSVDCSPHINKHTDTHQPVERATLELNEAAKSKQSPRIHDTCCHHLNHPYPEVMQTVPVALCFPRVVGMSPGRQGHARCGHVASPRPSLTSDRQPLVILARRQQRPLPATLATEQCATEQCAASITRPPPLYGMPCNK